jgi:hypothetical protein
MAGDVDHFADEVEAGTLAGLHGLRRELRRVHTTGSDFGLLEALGTRRTDVPGVQRLVDGVDLTVRGRRWA